MVSRSWIRSSARLSCPCCSIRPPVAVPVFPAQRLNQRLKLHLGLELHVAQLGNTSQDAINHILHLVETVIGGVLPKSLEFLHLLQVLKFSLGQLDTEVVVHQFTSRGPSRPSSAACRAVLARWDTSQSCSLHVGAGQRFRLGCA